MLKKLPMFLFVLFTILLLCGCAQRAASNLIGKNAVSREAKVVEATPAAPHNIALMLPLKGDLAAKSYAIKNGFLAAYYASRDQKSAVDVNVIDTSGGDITSLYNRAVTSGAQVVVGPLTKSDVEVLSTLSVVPVPIIALNTLDNYSHHVTTNLYQFGLLPQDEASQVADKILAAQKKHVAVIAPATSWGEKVVASFKNRLQTNGGQITAITTYTTSEELSSQICQLLALDPTQMCIPRSSKNKREPSPLEHEIRHDIDAVFMVASPKQARQIVPLLKFYYAGGLPVYSIAAVYSGNLQPNLDQDLNDVIFCAMPWVVRDPGALPDKLPAIHKEIVTTWPDSFASYSELYALGVDAYFLATSLHKIVMNPQVGTPGATGVLYLDNYNHFYRQLDWLRFQGGVPAPL